MGQSKISSLHYERTFVELASAELFQECADLYSQNYGKWSEQHADVKFAGRQIRLGPNKIREYLSGKNAWIGTARAQNDLVGYALVENFPRGSSAGHMDNPIHHSFELSEQTGRIDLAAFHLGVFKLLRLGNCLLTASINQIKYNKSNKSSNTSIQLI